MAIPERIEQLLLDGKPRIIRDICREINVDYCAVGEAVRFLARQNPARIAIVGSWGQLAAMRDVSMDNIRKDAGVYSHPGAELLPKFTALRDGKTKKRSTSGSGVIAPPPYRTGFCWGGIKGAYF